MSHCLLGEGDTTGWTWGDTPTSMDAASSRCGLRLGNFEKVGDEEEREKEKDEEIEEVPLIHTLCSSCPLFLRALSVSNDCDDCCWTAQLLIFSNSIEEVTQIPQQHWYCHGNGSPLPHGSAPHGLHRDCTVVMCARLKGGAPTIPGEWFCQVLSTWWVLASTHTLLQVRLQEGRRKLFAALRVNVRLWVVRHLLRELLHVPRNVGLHPSTGPGSLPIPNFLNRLSWRR